MADPYSTGLLPNGARIPESVRAQMMMGQLLAQGAGQATAPYTSKGVVGLKALQGFLGGQMEGSAAQGESQAQAAHRMAVANLLSGSLTAPASAGGASAGAPVGSAGVPLPTAMPMGRGGAGSDYAASKSHTDFIASIMPEAQRISQKTGIDARVIAAQAAHESNFGQSAPGGNLFGIKGAGSGPISTTESINGVMTPTKASFAAYDSPTAAFDGYGKLMSGPRYAGVRGGQSLDAQLDALGRSGYATDPNYAAKVGNIARGIQLPASAPVGVTAAQADMPALHAQPVASNTLPPDVTSDMVSAPPTKPSLDDIVTGAMAKAGMDTSGLPASASPPMGMQGAPPSAAAASFDPEGTGAANYDPFAAPVMGTSPAAMAQAPQSWKPDLGQAQPAAVPDPVTAATPDAAPSPSNLPPTRPPSGLGTAGAPMVPALKPSLDSLVSGAMAGAGMDTTGLPGAQPDPIAAAQRQGRDVAMDPVVPDPQGSLVPPAPPSPNGALAGPQSDAAMGNGAPPPASPVSPAAPPAPPMSMPGADDPLGGSMGTPAGAAPAPTPGAAPAPSMVGANGARSQALAAALMGGSPAAPAPSPAGPGPGAASPPPAPMPAPSAPAMGSGASLPQTGPMPPPRPADPAAGAPSLNGPMAPQGGAPGPSNQALAAALSGPQSMGLPGQGGADPSSPQNFMRQQALAAQLGSAQGGSTAAPADGMSGSPVPGGMPGGMFGGGQQQPAPAPLGGGALSSQGGASSNGPSQQQTLMALMNDERTTPQEMQMILSRLAPMPEKVSAGEGLVIRNPDGSYRNVYSQPGKDQYAYSPDGVHILNKGTGIVSVPKDGADGVSAGGWRPMSTAERQQYGVTDGRPAFVAPNNEPHFGMPETQGQGETAEAKTAGEAAANRRNDMLTGAMAAPEKVARLKLLGTVLDNTQTGPLAGETGTAASIATRLGIAPERLAGLGIDPNQAVNNAIANKLAGEMTMGSIGAKNGGMPASNFSVAERQFIEALYPNIENQAGGNRAVTDVLTAVEQRKMQVADAWSDYKDRQAAVGRPLSYENFEDQFRRAHSQDNIFAPIIQRYQAGGYTPTAPTAGGIPNTGAPPVTPGGGGQMGGSQGAQQRQGAPAPSDALAQAQAAIARGAPRAAVMQRLQSLGINTQGL